MVKTAEVGRDLSQFSQQEMVRLQAFKSNLQLNEVHEQVSSEVEDVSSIFENALFQKMMDVRTNWKEKGMKVNWYDFPGSGWNMRKQMNMLPSNWSSQELHDWLDQTKEDEKGFNLEYLCQGLVFPIFYDTRIVNGEERLYAPLYRKLVVDTVSDQERNGSVKQKIKELEQNMLTAQEGSLAVITSPAGWSGIPDENGKDIIFPDSQTYIFQKQGKEVKGFTMRTDFTLEEHRAVIKALTGNELPINASVVDYVNAISFLSPNNARQIYDIAGVMKLMENTRYEASKQTHAYINQTGKEKGKVRYWDEAYKSINNPDLWKFDEKTGEIFDRFIHLITSNEFSTVTTVLRKYGKEEKARELIRDALAVTIMDIANFLEGEKQIELLLQTTTFTSLESKQFAADAIRAQYGNSGYGDTQERIAAGGGCNGGGDSDSPYKDPTQKIIDSITPRWATISSLNQDNASESFSGICKKIKCGRPGCGWEPNESQAKEVGKSITKCPDCGWKPGDAKTPLINIDREVKQNKITIFETKKDSYEQAKDKIINRAVVQRQESTDTKKKHSITLFWGPLVKLKKIDEGN